MTKNTYRLDTILRLRKIAKNRKHARQKVGAAPGTIYETPGASETNIRCWSYHSGGAEPTDITGIKQVEDLKRNQADGSLLWVDVQGLASIELIQSVGQLFGLHSLVIEDVINVGQKPKAEVHDDDYIVVIMREPCGGPPFDSEQVGIVFGPNFVLTFQERHADIFDPVRKRLVEGSRNMTEIGAPYLGYCLIDAVIDGYFPILEGYGELTETLEQLVLEKAEPGLIADIHVLKRELLEMRRAVWAQREALNVLLRDETTLVPEALKVYLRDCADHSFQLLDMVEVCREVSQGLVELYMSSISNRMSDIMKVLTVISTIFIPMSFFAGLYGMNFDTSSPYNLPELKWKFGYFYCLGLMATSAVLMLFYFKRKGLIGQGS